jgi:hypothetical protein
MSPAWPVIPGVRAAGHVSSGGFWHSGGVEDCVKCWEARAPEGVRAIIIRSSDVEKCPRRSLAPAHYREDGSCRCSSEKG